MLSKLTHRGNDRAKLLEKHNVVMEAAWPEVQARPTPLSLQFNAVWDGTSAPLPDPKSLRQHREPFALAAVTPDGLFLARDPLGVKPLYFGKTDDGALCFASEVKALLEVTPEVYEFPPGSWYTLPGGIQAFAQVKIKPPLKQEPQTIAAGLRLRLEEAVCRRILSDEAGAWLSGGLDSSVMAALARPHVHRLHTFVSGVQGAPDLEYAGQMAEFLGSEHHTLIVSLDDLLKILPEVIYYLESFDALLVRSSLTNYLTARMVADYVGTVFSGEGGDELFAGYHYIKRLTPDEISSELEDIVNRLHNTALQRVDRSASAHGIIPLVPFLDMDVVEYAMSIPVEYKLYRSEGEPVEKWILRQAMRDALPESVLWRPKAKFWQGAGVAEILADYAAEKISNAEFQRERHLLNGWTLNTKEELMYYRIFRDHFGDLSELAWMGRTKGAPVQ